MDLNQEFSRNHAMLIRCNKIYKFSFYFFIASSILVLLFSVFESVGGIPDYTIRVRLAEAQPITPVILFFFLDAVLLAPVSAYLGYRATILHHDLSAIAIAIVHGLHLVLITLLKVKHWFDVYTLPYYVFAVFSAALITAALITLRNNVKFHWLEEQVGYPYFNERALDQEFDRRQMEIKSPYQLEMERRMKTATDSMTDLGSTSETLEKYEHQHVESEMDDI